VRGFVFRDIHCCNSSHCPKKKKEEELECCVVLQSSVVWFWFFHVVLLHFIFWRPFPMAHAFLDLIFLFRRHTLFLR